MKTFITVSNTMITAILDGVSFSEKERLQALAVAGLAPEKILDVGSRTSIVKFARFWNEILKMTGDKFIGLKIGMGVPGERFGLAVHAAQNSDDFRQVLTRFSRYACLINDLIRCDVSEIDGMARFSMKLHWNILGLERHAVDIAFAGIRRWADENLGGNFTLHEVRLRHSDDFSKKRYEDLLGAAAVFGARHNELVFDGSVLDVKIPGGNQELGQILDHYARHEAAKVPVLTDLSSRVAQIIKNELRDGRSISLADVASQLQISSRHLQRQLTDAATSFSGLLDEVRKDLAPEMLLQPDQNVEQVGYRLGYSEPTAFIRAFKKWYGMTPGEYRRLKISP